MTNYKKPKTLELSKYTDNTKTYKNTKIHKMQKHQQHQKSKI